MVFHEVEEKEVDAPLLDEEPGEAADEDLDLEDIPAVVPGEEDDKGWE